MDRQNHNWKLKSPYNWLLMIPLQLIVNVLMVPLGVWLDARIWEKVDFPRTDFLYLLPLLGGVVTGIVFSVSIVLTKEAVDRQKHKTPYKWLLLIPIQLLSTVLMIPLGMFLDHRIWVANSRVFAAHNEAVIEAGSGIPPLYMPRGLDYLVYLLPTVGAVISGVVIIAAMVLTIVSLVKRLGEKHIWKNRVPEKER